MNSPCTRVDLAWAIDVVMSREITSAGATSTMIYSLHHAGYEYGTKPANGPGDVQKLELPAD